MKAISENTHEYKFTKEELAILEPLEKKRDEITKDMQRFLASHVLPKLPVDQNKPIKTRFSVKGGWLRLKRTDQMQDLKKQNYNGVLGWQIQK